MKSINFKFILKKKNYKKLYKLLILFKQLKKIKLNLKWKSKLVKEIFKKKIFKFNKVNYNLIKLITPLTLIKQKLIYIGLLNIFKSPISLKKIVNFNYKNIILFYKIIIKSLLDFFRCTDNFFNLKNLINTDIRWSFIKTLSQKQKKSKSRLLKHFKNLYKINLKFPNYKILKNLKKKFLFKIKILHLNQLLKYYLI